MKLILFLFFIISQFNIEARDVTFFLSSDPHYGYKQKTNNEQLNKDAIDDMNSLPGKAYPNNKTDHQTVSEPYGVIVTGDLTGSASAYNWSGYPGADGFDTDYEVSGNGRLKYPVYEGYGNHDVHTKGQYAVLTGIYYRNQARATPVKLSSNGMHYSWDWEDVHFIQLNLFPGNKEEAMDSLAFLKADLKKIDNQTPIVIFHHYEFKWEPERWFSTKDQETYYNAIKNHNIIAIFTGHVHRAQSYTWKGIQVFTAPTVKENLNYLVIHILDKTLLVNERKDGKWSGKWEINLKEKQL